MDGAPKKRVRKSKAQRQKEIVEVTLRLIPKYGLRGTTVSRIAGAAGLSRGALYQHFANREAVLFAAMELMAQRVWRWITGASGPDGYHQLIDVAARHAPFAASEFNTFVRPNLELMATSARGNVSKYVHARQVKTLQAFLDIVAKGKQDGSIRGDIESDDIAWALLTFAWAEDLARVMGLEEYIDSGASMRNLRRTLAGFAAVDEPECDGAGAPGD